MQGGIGDSYCKLWSSVPDTTLHPNTEVQREGRLSMDDVGRWEAHYGQGGINSRHRTHRLLQLLHQVAKVINIPTYDPILTQGL